jgi:hypothetical protein
MDTMIRPVIVLLALSAIGPMPSRRVPDPQPGRCVQLRDASSGRVVSGARVRLDGSATGQWSDNAGRVCWGEGVVRVDAPLLIDALGYRAASQLLAAGPATTITLRPLAESDIRSDSAVRRAQVAVGLAQFTDRLAACEALRLPSCRSALRSDTSTASLQVADSTDSDQARRQLRARALPLLSELQTLFDTQGTVSSPTDPATDGVVLTSFVDTPDPATRYAEVRLVLRRSGQTTLGITETVCPPSGCVKARQVALLWGIDPDSVSAPEFAVIDEGAAGRATIFDVGTAPASAPPVRAADAPALRVRSLAGTVRDGRGVPLANVEILSAPDDQRIRTDSLGRYALTVVGNGAVLLTARAMGFAPAYHAVAPTSDSVSVWDPRLRSIQQLAARTVRASGMPFGLSSWRYDDVLARRAKGVGKFLVGDEIWSTTGVGDALNRVPGITVIMGPGGLINKIRMVRCNNAQVSDGRIGLFVDGFERTSQSSIVQQGSASTTLTAEQLLSELQVREIMAIEVYRGRGEIPAEFANPRYCAVIALWMR